MPVKTIILLTLSFFICSCTKDNRRYKGQKYTLNDIYFNPINQKQNNRSGRYLGTKKQNNTWKKVDFNAIKLPQGFNMPFKALEVNADIILNSNKLIYNINDGEMIINEKDLAYVAHIMELYNYLDPVDISLYLDIYQLCGEDGLGNVKFTGYYTPNLSYSAERTDSVSIPLIVGKEKSEDLDTICYVPSQEDIINIKMQGSAILTIDDTIQKHISYLRKQSFKMKDSIVYHYIFKKRHSIIPYGATGHPLAKDYSIAVDPKFIPLGATLISAVPKRISRHKVVHETRILLAQDTGGGIKGPDHVDLFKGIDDDAYEEAIGLRHYGKIFLILPRK